MTTNPYQAPVADEHLGQTVLVKVLSPLGVGLFILVIIHFVMAVAGPLLFVLDSPTLTPEALDLAMRAWSIWRWHPVLVALCLFLFKRDSPEYRSLLGVDIAISLLQAATPYFLLFCYEARLFL
jgi:hypothetical protein